MCYCVRPFGELFNAAPQKNHGVFRRASVVRKGSNKFLDPCTGSSSNWLQMITQLGTPKSWR